MPVLNINTLKGVDQEFADTFGNYLLHGIAEVELPSKISWLPQTIAWKILLLLLLILLVFTLFKGFKHWQANAYRRQAVKQLKSLYQSGEGVLEILPVMLKSTALHAYPRSNVAQLSGHQWLDFLDQQYQGPAFNSDVGKQLLIISYEDKPFWNRNPEQIEALISMASLWLAKHSPVLSHKDEGSGHD
jgi:hypothetical protein